MVAGIVNIPLGITNCYLIRGNNYIMIDAGSPGRQSRFLKLLIRKNIDPAAIDFIFITHGHWDHSGSLKAIKSITGAKAGVNYREKDWIQNGLTIIPPALGVQGKIMELLMKLGGPMVKMPKTKIEILIPDIGLDLSSYGVAGKIIHTPGHTHGSMSMVLDSGEAFVGDLCMSGFPQLKNTCLPVLGDNLAMIKESWKILLEHNVKEIYPAHGKPFSAQLLEKAFTRN